MNVHIILEEVTIDTNFKKQDLLNILKEYTNFKETSLEDAEYFIIIPNYPSTGKQNFSDKLAKFIMSSNYLINDETLFLLDSDNSLYPFDIEKSKRQVWFKDESKPIYDIFGFTPKQVAEATNHIKLGKHSSREQEEKYLRDQYNYFDKKEVIKATQKVETKKRSLLLG